MSETNEKIVRSEMFVEKDDRSWFFERMVVLVPFHSRAQERVYRVWML